LKVKITTRRAAGGSPLRPMAPVEDLQDAHANRPSQHSAAIGTDEAEEDAPPRSCCSQGGVGASVLVLIGTSLGGGLLSVPYVLRLSGVGFGTLMLVFGGLFSHVGLTALMEMSRRAGKEGTSYGQLFAHCLGPLAAPVLDGMLWIYGMGACTAYLVLIGDFVPALAKLCTNGGPLPWYGTRTTAILVATMLCIPTALQPEVSCLRFLTPISVTALAYTGAVVAAKTYTKFNLDDDQPGYGPVEWVDVNLHFFEALSLCSFAFNCHLNAVPVAVDIACTDENRERIITRVSALANIIPMLFYAVIGLTGYLSFLALTPQDILLGYASNEPFVVVARVLLTCSMLVVIPVNSVPTIRSGLQLCDYLSGKRCAVEAGSARTVVARDAGVPLRSSSSVEDGEAVVTSQPMQHRTLSAQSVSSHRPREFPPGLRIALGLFCLLAEAIVALCCKSIATINSFLGSTISVAMMALIPAYCMTKMLEPTLTNRLKQVFLVMAALLNLASVPLMFVIGS